LAPHPPVSARTAAGSSSREIQRVSGAEAPCRRQFAVGQVDGDNQPGAAERSALHAVQADATGADHHDLGPGRDLRRVSTVPRPVMRPHASSDATSRFTPVGIAATCEAWTVTRAAKAPGRIA
jgi:hypothetical protein